MKIPFFWKSEKQDIANDILDIIPLSNKNANAKDTKNDKKAKTGKSGKKEDEPAQKPKTNYGEEFHKYVKTNFGEKFDKKISRTGPFIITSILAWPSYWIFKGLQWTKRRRTENIQSYIHSTFKKAKLMQIAILSCGIVAALYEPAEKKPEPEPTKKDKQDKDKIAKAVKKVKDEKKAIEDKKAKEEQKAKDDKKAKEDKKNKDDKKGNK